MQRDIHVIYKAICRLSAGCIEIQKALALALASVALLQHRGSRTLPTPTGEVAQ